MRVSLPGIRCDRRVSLSIASHSRAQPGGGGGGEPGSQGPEWCVYRVFCSSSHQYPSYYSPSMKDLETLLVIIFFF